MLITSADGRTEKARVLREDDSVIFELRPGPHTGHRYMRLTPDRAKNLGAAMKQAALHLQHTTLQFNMQEGPAVQMRFERDELQRIAGELHRLALDIIVEQSRRGTTTSRVTLA